jgi:quinol monooxygenase YgiN
MIVIAGHLDLADPSQRDELVAASAPLQLATRDDEPGCLAYVFTADPCVEGRVHIYEAWTDGPSLDAHFQHANYFGMRELLGRYERAGGSVLKHRVDASDPVYGPDRLASSRFWSVDPV